MQLVLIVRKPAALICGGFFRILYDLGRPLAAVPDFIYNVLIKFRFMADEKQGSPVFPKGLFQGILSVCI